MAISLIWAIRKDLCASLTRVHDLALLQAYENLPSSTRICPVRALAGSVICKRKRLNPQEQVCRRCLLNTEHDTSRRRRQPSPPLGPLLLPVQASPPRTEGRIAWGPASEQEGEESLPPAVWSWYQILAKPPITPEVPSVSQDSQTSLMLSDAHMAGHSWFTESWRLGRSLN